MWLYGIISALVIASVGYYLIYYVPTKERKEDHKKKAIELTKDIGNKKIKCISLTTNSFNGGRVFYIIEDGAETDPSKYICRLEEGWDKSAYSIEEARRNVKEIIHHMPYSLYWIEDLEISETDFFKLRRHNKKLQETNKSISDDQERMQLYFFPDFMDIKLSIIRFNHTVERTNYDDKYYYYVLLIHHNKQKKYMLLFDYPTYEDEYANLRLESYITYYNQNNPWGGKIDTKIACKDEEICDFLEAHPLYTHQYLYRNLDSIEPYYESQYPI